MASPEGGGRRRSRRVDLALAVGVLVALGASALPLLRVVSAGPWVTQAAMLVIVVLATGFAARSLRWAAVAVSLAEIAVWVAAVMILFARGTGLLVVIPTGDTLSLVSLLFSAAVEDVAVGAAPLNAGAALSFLIVSALGALAIVLDHVVITARMPLLAAVGLVAVSLIPSIAVPGDFDAWAFVLLAISILYLLRVDTRARQRTAAAETPPPRGTLAVLPPAGAGTASATALGIGAVAVVIALVAGPLLPAPLARAGGGGASANGTLIDASLELGDDLRQPDPVEVLRVRWTGEGAPYLRVATLSEFDGSVWDPDENRALPLTADAPDLPAVDVDPGIQVTPQTARVDVVDLNSRWAPVPYPVTDVTGLDGDWSVAPASRTVIAGNGSVQGQAYEAVTASPVPNLDQIRLRDASGTDEPDVYDLPAEMPAVIAETAAEVTENARNDYDALIALQSWFRGSQFEYSLDSPVSDGFDGTGVDAIAQFLDVREGYCVHYASAFAVMARTLGMPSRIVVGYLPGTSTGESIDGQTVYSVVSTQLHSWPEVFFEGVGWVPFEPTNSLGTPTNFAAAPATPSGASPSSAPANPSATPSPTPTASAGGSPADDLDPGSTAAGGGAASRPLWPALLALVAALALVSVPGIVGALRRRRRRAEARGGDAAAAWLAVQERAVDLGIPVPASESPRAFGSRLVRQRGADPTAMDTLVTAIERASYAREPDPGSGEQLMDAVDTVSSGLLATVSGTRRLLAQVLPRSLAVRPGSAYAGTISPTASVPTS
ncbi:DUF3488 and DUF4129 domain-containing transglutaminase family protein [Microbacterium sp. P04]|uniref:transglutaminase TgpA family protein n=1 Tax=Microbacterium sp. P04 TaxID=3366947 RepID=UPI003745A7D8